ncbi:unnamed protein product [Hermetia illucens]|uniref:F-box domain-containing protein n=1 Tax=Hermetia illucens TaxID=343691 RepID=A0A7R8UYI5_HERIL|nr:F-box/LRR-repeat protein 21 [Hermetia illucens]CAD7088896.1 unnamed protein product [Hermetia illucens]
MSKIEEKAQKGCWKIDENDEACYIDVEEEVDYSDPNREYSHWHELPDLLLEEIFKYLEVRERYYASLVCRSWYRAFHLPPVWSNFVVDDRTLTRAKYNYYSGWQHTLDHLRTQSCFTRVGRYIKGLDFRPEHSFNNLFQFMTLMTWCITKGREERCLAELKDIGCKIKSLVYTFPCHMSQAEDPQGIKLFGTGGELLLALKKLMAKLDNLRILKLIDLVLERFEANHLLDEVLDSCCTQLRVLYLVNTTTVHCPIMHVGLFVNLQILVISPQNIDDDVLILLADAKLKHLHLLQNRYTPPHYQISGCSPKAWQIIRRDNPQLRVHIRVESGGCEEFVFQPNAPVYSILYATPKTRITTEGLLRMIDNYRGTLTIYGHEMLPKYCSPKSFHSRIDSALLLMTRQCYNITTLVIREKVSTSTLLLLAKSALNLRDFHVRRNAVILRCDWPYNPEWSNEFYCWLKCASRSYESTEKEIAQILGKRWTLLSDKDFKRVTVNVRQKF